MHSKINSSVTLPSRQAAEQDASVPVSSVQARLWFLDQYHPQQAVAQTALAQRYSGKVDEVAFIKALESLPARHAILRCRFVAVDGHPQAIPDASSAALPLERNDLSNDPPAAREQKLRTLIDADTSKRLALETGECLRARWVRCSDEEHVLILVCHGMVLDKASLQMLADDLVSAHTAYAQGTPRLPAAGRDAIGDHAVREQVWLKTDAAAAQSRYWRNRLSAPLPALQLFTDRPRPPLLSLATAHVARALPATLSTKLYTGAEQQGVTPTALALSAFSALLNRYTAQTDIIIGTATAGRSTSDIKALGSFAFYTPIRIDFSTRRSVQQHVHAIHCALCDAEVNNGLSLDRIIAAVEPPRDQSRAALFQAVFELETLQDSIALTPSVTVQPLTVNDSTDGYDIKLRLLVFLSHVELNVAFNSDLFTTATMERLSEHFETLLLGLLEEPTRQLTELNILPITERELLLTHWNNTAAEFPGDRCSHELFEDQVTRTPDAVAVEARGQQLTYAELNARANQLAHYLRQQGAGPEAIVGICLERTLELAVALLGVLKAGAAYLPLEPSHPQDRIGYVLKHSRPKAIVTLSQFVSCLPQQPLNIALDRDWRQIATLSTDNPVTMAGPQNLVYVIYTSGSTGRPKGVAITHRGLINYLWWAIHEYQAEQGCGSPVHSPLSFDLTVTSLWTPLLTGRKAILLPDGEDALIQCLQTERNLSLVKLTPAHVTLLGQTLPAESVAGRANAFVIGGEALRGETLTFWCKNAPATRLINEYGPTETVVGCCTYEVPADELPTGDILIGRPNANCQLYVLDRHLNPAPLGVPGELYIGGTGLARGYLHRPDLTAERFVPNPFANQAGERLYKTGDLARYRTDGNLEYLGRVDHQVKIRGFRIELGEIEARLLEHNAVEEAVVIVREDVPGGKQLVAYAAPAQRLDVATLREHLRARVPDYMVPGLIVLMDGLPLNSNGKVERKALPRPDTAALRPIGCDAPRTPTERALCDIWRDILQLPRVGIRDNFFELGGHSLLAVRLLATIKRRFKLELPLASIFQAPTIAELATAVDAKDWASPYYSLVPIHTVGNRPTLFAIHTLTLKDLPKHLGEDQPLYFIRYGMADKISDEPVTLPHLKDLAAHYIEEMQRSQPEGPYYLIGASFGGLVAYEMACQLRSNGQSVALLAMFDSHLTNERERLPFTAVLNNIKRQSPGEIWGRIRRKVETLMTRTRYGSDYWPHIYTAAPDSILAAAYVAEPYDGEVILFKAESGWGSITYRHVPPEIPWQRLIRGRLVIDVIPGDHIGIIEEPNVRTLVAHLRNHMDSLGAITD